MLFGVVAVNKYYGYYQTWGAALADLTNQGGATGNTAPPPALAAGPQLVSALTRSDTSLKLAQQQGYTLHLTVTGPRSHITRSVYVYLPPEYFQPSYKAYRFPVIELIHGQPGEPQDWINVVGITATMDHLVSEGRAKPAVLVMPAANGAQRVSLQCLNQAGGPQDLTYLAQELPLAIAHRFRVEPPGPAWAVAGYSEGGFCAANMALRFPGKYGFAGVLSGYFKPDNNQLEFPLRQVSPFGGNRKLARENTPLDEVRKLKLGTPDPAVLAGRGHREQGGRGQRRGVLAGAEPAPGQRAADPDQGRRARHDHLAGRGPGHAGLDDAPAGPGRGGRGGRPLAAPAAVRLGRAAPQAASPPAGQEPGAGRPAGPRRAPAPADRSRQAEPRAAGRGVSRPEPGGYPRQSDLWSIPGQIGRCLDACCSRFPARPRARHRDAAVLGVHGQPGRTSCCAR